jgi:hypothetical protein
MNIDVAINMTTDINADVADDDKPCIFRPILNVAQIF